LAQQGLSRRVALTLPDPLSAARMVVGSDMALTAGRRVLAHVADRSPVRILPVPFLSHGVKVGLSWPVRLSREAAHVWLRGRLQTLFQDRH
jgi:DNA-binding transcriptional LysR family regulator